MRKKLILLSVILITGAYLSFSQVRIPGEKGTLTKQATIRLSDMEEGEADRTVPFKAPNKNWHPPQWTLEEEDIIYQETIGFNYFNPRTVNGVSPPADTTFNALDDTGSSIPPDVNGAAGPDHLMTTLNTQIRVQDKKGNTLHTTHLGTFWKSMPNDGGTFDPKILYDPYEDRWIMVTCSSSNPADSKLYFGVSVTSDPLGEWYLYWLDPDLTNVAWFDYPSYGFNRKWITVSGNMFGGDYYRTVFAIDKKAVYNGEDSPNHTRFATTEAFTLVPSITYDPNEEDMYLISTSNGNSGGYGYIKKFKLSGDVNDPVFEYEGAIGVPEPWENSAGNYGNFLPQLGSSELINSVDSRMENVIFRNGKLWAVHHIFLPVGNPQRAAIQLWELDTDGTILNRYRIQDTTNLFSFAFPTVAVNANEDIIVGHNVFSSTQYAGAGYSFKAYYDEGNTMRTYHQYKEGENTYYKTFGAGRNRWGDYSNTCVDPSNDINFWVIQEYATSSANMWGTWWASVIPSYFPIADFIADEIIIPVGETVNFTDLTGGVPSSWNWTFENGTPATSNQQNPEEIQFNEEGTFKVQLIASNDLGTDTIVKDAYITTSSTLLPEVEFVSDKSLVCIGEPISFTDKSVYSPNQWEWQFDPSGVTFENGTDQNSQNPVVSFNSSGNYAVTLTVWNLNGSSELTKFDMMLAGGIVPEYYKETFDTESFSNNFWTVENPDDDVTWQLFEVGGTGPGNTAAGVDFNNYFVIGQRDRLISPNFNLEGMSSAALEFQHAYAKRHDAISDSLIVYVSGDCGDNWTRVFAGGEDGSGNFATHQPTDGDFWPMTTTDWCGFGWGASCTSIDLSQWAGMPDIKVAFETWSAYGNPLMIDNVIITLYVGEEEVADIESDVKIFPNPTNGSFKVIFEGNMHYDQFMIYNKMGQVIYQSDIDDTNKSIVVNTDKWSSGIYFIKLKGKDASASKRLIVN